MSYVEYTVKVFDNGNKHWYVNGKFHRDDGPAIECADGDKQHWYVNGRHHRDDGPAAEYANGDKLWYINGKLHRDDGPAIERANGYKEWYINGVKLTKDEFDKRLNSCEGKVVEIEGKKYELKLIK